MRCAALISVVAVSVRREEMPLRLCFFQELASWNVLVDGAAEKKNKKDEKCGSSNRQPSIFPNKD